MRIILILLAIASRAPSLELDWEPSPEGPRPAGYRIYYGRRSGDHPTLLEVGNVLSANLSMAPGPWFFVLVAYDASGFESLPSNEVQRSGEQPGPPREFRIRKTNHTQNR